MDLSRYQPINTKEKVDALLKEIGNSNMRISKSMELEILFAIKKEKIQRYFKEQLSAFNKTIDANFITKKYLEKKNEINVEFQKVAIKRKKKDLLKEKFINKIIDGLEQESALPRVVKMVTREELAQIRKQRKSSAKGITINEKNEAKTVDDKELPNSKVKVENAEKRDIVFYLKWENISFYDGYYVFLPNNMNGSKKSMSIKPLIVKDPQCLKVYNYINSYFKIKLPSVRYEITSKRKIRIIDEIKFRNAILMIQEEYKQRKMWKQLSDLNVGKGGKVSHKDFIFTYANISPVSFRKYKSLFIDYLINKQLNRYRIVPLIESFAYENSFCLSEDAFLFSVRAKLDNIAIILENVNPNRATLLFVVKEEYYMDALKTIYTLMQGNTLNKRSKLRAKILSMEKCGIIQYFSINHESFVDWKSRIQGLIEK